MGNLLADLNFDLLNGIDAVKMRRLRRMEARTRRMDAEAYKRFAVARQTSFYAKWGRRSPMFVKQFLAWLQAPKLDDGLADIVNYCAMEIVVSFNRKQLAT